MCKGTWKVTKAKHVPYRRQTENLSRSLYVWDKSKNHVDILLNPVDLHAYIYETHISIKWNIVAV